MADHTGDIHESNSGDMDFLLGSSFREIRLVVVCEIFCGGKIVSLILSLTFIWTR
jgi:hypothetical protein